MATALASGPGLYAVLCSYFHPWLQWPSWSLRAELYNSSATGISERLDRSLRPGRISEGQPAISVESGWRHGTPGRRVGSTRVGNVVVRSTSTTTTRSA